MKQKKKIFLNGAKILTLITYVDKTFDFGVQLILKKNYQEHFE